MNEDVHAGAQRKIKGICEGGVPFQPLRAGDLVLDEDGDTLEFITYSTTGWSGIFRLTRHSPLFTLPLSGLLPLSFESAPSSAPSARNQPAA